jgi:hypothetical protein
MQSSEATSAAEHMKDSTDEEAEDGAGAKNQQMEATASTGHPLKAASYGRWLWRPWDTGDPHGAAAADTDAKVRAVCAASQ